MSAGLATNKQSPCRIFRVGGHRDNRNLPSQPVESGSARSMDQQQERKRPKESQMAALVKMVQRVGPYVVMAIVMPGGTFVALGLYFYRRHRGLE
jgi:hypothetical protein